MFLLTRVMNRWRSLQSVTGAVTTNATPSGSITTLASVPIVTLGGVFIVTL